MKTLRPAAHLCAALIVAFALLASSGESFAQSDVEKTLQQFSAQDVKGYVQPLADLFGSNMNAGIFHSAAIGKSGFHLTFEIVGMGSMVTDKLKTYTINAPPGYVPSSFSTATIFGGRADSIVSPIDPNSYYHGIADGIFNTSIFPLATPQLTLGDVYGTRAIVRFIATPAIAKLPSATLWGLGLQHSLSQHFSVLPLDVAVHAFYTKFTFGSLIDLSGLSIGVDASKSFSVLNLYGGFAWEKSTMDLTYTPSNSTLPAVDLSLDGANTVRLTLGLGLNLGVFALFADANFGSITSVSAGLAIGG